MGKGFKKAIKGIGKVVGKGLKIASPFAALIPGVGPLAAAGLGAAGKALGRAFSGQNTFGKGGAADILGTGAIAGLGSAGAKALGGQSKVLRYLGKSVKDTFTTPGGGLDLGRVAGAGMGAANLIGAHKQRRSVDKYNAANQDLRSQLLSRVLQSPQYDFNQGR